MKEPLFDQWTVYDHPTDFPDAFVARCFRHDPSVNEYYPSERVIVSEDIDTLREVLAGMGLTHLDRFDGDHPDIMEVWL